MLQAIANRADSSPATPWEASQGVASLGLATQALNQAQGTPFRTLVTQYVEKADTSQETESTPSPREEPRTSSRTSRSYQAASASPRTPAPKARVQATDGPDTRKAAASGTGAAEPAADPPDRETAPPGPPAETPAPRDSGDSGDSKPPANSAGPGAPAAQQAASLTEAMMALVAEGSPTSGADPSQIPVDTAGTEGQGTGDGTAVDPSLATGAAAGTHPGINPGASIDPNADTTVGQTTRTSPTAGAAGTTPSAAPPDLPAPVSGLTPAQVKAALDKALPGTRLQTSTSTTEGAAPAKAALTEFLNQPTAPVETPRLPAQEGAEARILQASTQQPQRTPDTAPVTGGAEAVLAVTAPGASSAVRVAATTATAEAPVPTSHGGLVSQVDGSIRWLLKNQDQGAELQLHPESLGTVQIKLRVEGTEVHARVWASDPSALPVLQENRAYLEASLKQQGLHLGSFDLQQGRQGEQTPQSSQPAPSAPAPLAALPEAGQESPSLSPPTLANAHRIEIVA